MKTITEGRSGKYESQIHILQERVLNSIYTASTGISPKYSQYRKEFK